MPVETIIWSKIKAGARLSDAGPQDAGAPVIFLVLGSLSYLAENLSNFVIDKNNFEFYQKLKP